MSCLAWNCCGLGNPQAIQTQKDLVRREDPQVIFLLETRLPISKLERVRLVCAMDSCVGFEAEVAEEGWL